jgi:molecular chaperone HtpG
MKTDQTEIFYLAGDSREKIERNPNLEYFIKNDIEVIYLFDPMDVFVIPYIFEYSEKKIISIEKAEINIDNQDENKEEINPDSQSKILELFKTFIGDKVEDIVISKRLINSPVTLVAGKNALDPQYEKMMHMLNKDFQSSKKILEININHPIISNIMKQINNPEKNQIIQEIISQLYDSALLLEGSLSNPNEFINRMYKFLENSTNN